MKVWRNANPNKARSQSLAFPGIELSINQLIDCKRLVESLRMPNLQKVKTHLLGGFFSHFKGRGMDFDEARLYQIGDDIRSIDWRVTARTGEAHTKIYREERERPVSVILDQSANMMFGTQNQFKSVLAAEIAATIMWRTLNDGNRFGALLFNDTEHFEFKPASSRKSCLKVLNQMVVNHEQSLQQFYYSEESPSVDPASLKDTLLRARKIAKPGSLFYIVSDFKYFDLDAEQQLIRLAQHCDIHLVKISDPIEKNLPAPGYYSISQGRSQTQISTHNKQTREAFKQSYLNQSHILKTMCQKHQIKFHDISTSQTLKSLLQQVTVASDE